MNRTFTAQPPRLFGRYRNDPPVILAEGEDKTTVADERKLTANMGHGWRVWREVAMANYERRNQLP